MAIQLCKSNAERAKTEADCAIKLKEDTIAHTNEVIDQLTKRKNELSAAIDETIAVGNKHADEIVENYYTNTLDEYQRDLLNSQMNLLGEAREQFNAEITKLSCQYNDLKNEVEDFAARRDAINQEIIRQRKLAEEKDFYRICITENDKKDITFLLSISDNIRNKQAIYKVIWSEYIQKPFNEMLKRVLAGKEWRGVIYKITNIQTGEIYIGKTRAEVAKRWTEHIKTSLNIGTIAQSKIHLVLFNHWDEFSFEVLEKVEDDSLLSERERFYINFYQSNIYGYNMNSGG